MEKAPKRGKQTADVKLGHQCKGHKGRVGWLAYSIFKLSVPYESYDNYASVPNAFNWEKALVGAFSVIVQLH